MIVARNLKDLKQYSDIFVFSDKINCDPVYFKKLQSELFTLCWKGEKNVVIRSKIENFSQDYS